MVEQSPSGLYTIVLYVIVGKAFAENSHATRCKLLELLFSAKANISSQKIPNQAPCGYAPDIIKAGLLLVFCPSASMVHCNPANQSWHRNTCLIIVLTTYLG